MFVILWNLFHVVYSFLNHWQSKQRIDSTDSQTSVLINKAGWLCPSSKPRPNELNDR